jgi:hypothetical protein
VAALAVELGAVLPTVDALGKCVAGIGVAALAGDAGQFLGVGNLVDIRMAVGAGQAAVDGGLEGDRIRVERDLLPLDLFGQSLVRVAAEAILVGRPGGRPPEPAGPSRG